MTIARKELVDSHNPGFYHCTNRCVRRAFLCGLDEETGRNFNHRRTWIERRLLQLSSIFSVDIYAYATMSNHYHIVLYVDPLAPLSWSDDDIAERWLLAYPSKDSAKHAQRKQALLNNPDKLTLYRQRLGSLSWFMNRLNEPLAKMSNLEDQCSGKFWEARYSSQALLDEAALLSCMAYVDLNPIRANLTQTLETSHFTSIKYRIQSLTSKEQRTPVQPILGSLKTSKLNLSPVSYINLVEWIGQSILYPNKAAIPKHITSVLERLNLQPNHWLMQIQHFDKHYCRMIGPVEMIREKARLLKRCYLRGISSARMLYTN